ERVVGGRFGASTGFTYEPLPPQPSPPTELVETPAFRIETATLDHRIPCLAFRVGEQRHLNVRTDVLADRGLRPGRWLAALKEAIRTGDHAARITLPSGDAIAASELGRELIVDRPGQHVAYVVDTRFDVEN